MFSILFCAAKIVKILIVNILTIIFRKKSGTAQLLTSLVFAYQLGVACHFLEGDLEPLGVMPWIQGDVF